MSQKVRIYTETFLKPMSCHHIVFVIEKLFEKNVMFFMTMFLAHWTHISLFYFHVILIILSCNVSHSYPVTYNTELFIASTKYVAVIASDKYVAVYFALKKTDTSV
jgi:hypothetical protein